MQLPANNVLGEIVKNTNNAVIVTDPDRRIVYTNPGFTKITGYSLQEVKGKSPSLLQGPDTNQRTVNRIAEKLKKLERVNETILNYDKSGKKYWIQLDIYPFLDGSGSLQHFMAIQSVVTEMKMKEIMVKEQALRIKENISYAKTLQDSLFRKSEKAKILFKDHFILDLPKDEVGGDFYLFEEYQNQKVILVGDCTGHGVSGAIMTAMCISVVSELLNRYKTLSPAMILNKANEKLLHMMRNAGSHAKDGMEATLVFIDETKKCLRYASGKQALYLLNEGQEVLLKGSKRKNDASDGYELIDETIPYKEGSMLFMGTDGLQDQIGGEEFKRLSSKQLLRVLGRSSKQICVDQKCKIEDALSEWQRTEEEQTDDILLMGFRL